MTKHRDDLHAVQLHCRTSEKIPLFFSVVDVYVTAPSLDCLEQDNQADYPVVDLEELLGKHRN